MKTITQSGIHKSALPIQLTRILLLISGLLVLLVSLLSPQFRDAEGFLESAYCFPLALSFVLVFSGISLNKKWNAVAGWFSLLIIGQAASLQLIKAGNQIGYQHYDLQDSSQLPFVALLLFQTIIVVCGLKSHWRKLWDWLVEKFSIWQLLAIGFFFVISSTALSRNIQFYAIELIIAVSIQFINLLTLILTVLALPKDMVQKVKNKLHNLFESSPKNNKKKIDRFAILCCIWVFVLAAILNVFAYERHPHIPDEVVYLYHAKYFSEGNFVLTSPPITDAFDVNLMYYDDENGRWFSPVPPGWPAFLALGSLFGIPFIVNPLLGGINILLIYILLPEISNKQTARISILLLSVSPWFIFMSMNYMTHTFTLTCALIAAIATVQMKKKYSHKWALISGAAIGSVSLIRPLEGLAVAIIMGIIALSIRPWGKKIAVISLMVITSLLVAGSVLPYNDYLTGQATKFPIMEYTDKYYGVGSNSLGFGPEKGLGWVGIDPYPGHGLRDVAVNTTLNMFLINIELFGWSIGSLLLVLIALFSKATRTDLWMLAFILLIIGLHSLYWFNGGPDFGARYWFLIIVPCAFLSVRGIQVLAEKIGTSSNIASSQTYILIGILLLSSSTLVNFFPWRAIDKYHHYRGMRPGIRTLTNKHNFKNSLVFIRGKRHPDYMSAFIYNPTDLSKGYSEEPLYVWDKNPIIRQDVLEYYPNRKRWFVDGPSITQRNFQISEGPLINRGSSE